ncbi:hypothetical protein [Caulobacter sp. S45]|uniref:hypothetical protein n=1 Tax=Caulobacter sp. S45 TaxID=1641861 RepID=UPI00131B919B|nr:hypothetical protein [Caulobacter sp. S45]
MEHYVQLDHLNGRIGTWEFTDRDCVRIDTTPGRGGMYHFTAPDGVDLWDFIGEKCAWFREGPNATFQKLDLAPGQYHPRMARPSAPDMLGEVGFCPGEDEDRIAIAKIRGQLSVLTRTLEELCQTVHPEGANLDVYGHDIRNLLILACTEVEAHWRGILQANGLKPDRPNTADYVKLCRPMRLTDYAISIAAFPWLEPIAPFRTWGASDKPSQDLPWYQAYNDTKHDRDGRFARATLRSAIEAVLASVVMAVAQFGLERALGDGALLIANYTFVEAPMWKVGEIYTPAYDVAGWQSVDFKFAPADPLAGNS